MRGGVVGYELPIVQASVTAIAPGDVLIFATDGIRPSFTAERAAIGVTTWFGGSITAGRTLFILWYRRKTRDLAPPPGHRQTTWFQPQATARLPGALSDHEV